MGGVSRERNGCRLARHSDPILPLLFRLALVCGRRDQAYREDSDSRVRAGQLFRVRLGLGRIARGGQMLFREVRALWNLVAQFESLREGKRWILGRGFGRGAS